MEQDYLIHYGVLGMKWGVRKSKPSSGTKTKRSTKRKAKKDAKEYARAKMFYGEGAGNRRKLIKATVNDRSKNLTGYKAEFEKHLANQDMSKHASAAKKERTAKNVKKSTAKTARGFVHAMAGNKMYASAAAIAIYAAAHASGVDRIIANAAKTKMSNVATWIRMSSNARKRK